jgi:hypothetical protein
MNFNTERRPFIMPVKENVVDNIDVYDIFLGVFALGLFAIFGLVTIDIVFDIRIF